VFDSTSRAFVHPVFHFRSFIYATRLWFQIIIRVLTAFANLFNYNQACTRHRYIKRYSFLISFCAFRSRFCTRTRDTKRQSNVIFMWMFIIYLYFPSYQQSIFIHLQFYSLYI
jgi:hypothetical protein